MRLEKLINGRRLEGPEGVDEGEKAYSEAQGSGWARKVGGEDQKKQRLHPGSWERNRRGSRLGGQEPK